MIDLKSARWLLSLALALALPSSAYCAAPAKPPNIILTDDLGYGDTGVHGGKDVPTPNIDALAAGGVRCTSGYVSAPYYSPFRAGFLLEPRYSFSVIQSFTLHNT